MHRAKAWTRQRRQISAFVLRCLDSIVSSTQYAFGVSYMFWPDSLEIVEQTELVQSNLTTRIQIRTSQDVHA